MNKAMAIKRVKAFLELARSRLSPHIFQKAHEICLESGITFEDIGETQESLELLKQKIDLKEIRRLWHDASQRLNMTSFHLMVMRLDGGRIGLTDIGETEESFAALKKKILPSMARDYVRAARESLDKDFTGENLAFVLDRLKAGEVLYEQFGETPESFAELQRAIDLKTARHYVRLAREKHHDGVIETVLEMLSNGLVASEKLGMTAEALTTLRKNIWIERGKRYIKSIREQLALCNLALADLDDVVRMLERGQISNADIGETPESLVELRKTLYIQLARKCLQEGRTQGNLSSLSFLFHLIQKGRVSLTDINETEESLNALVEMHGVEIGPWNEEFFKL